MRALTAKKNERENVQAYLLSGKKRSWREVYDFVKEQFPSLPIKLEPADRSNYEVDASKAERELGIQFKGMEVQVSEVVKQQLELGPLEC